ncbi:S8 family serine peptidase [Reichenbachiella agarivorans]|uniref:S8 family serine peptidase n=1 Tax=Reichenbachiella agarivorans TaxID=2979464 RepID=A0ABY6CU77_9BACT|nr:S8 family serine peptidase [Reichenbachiella agarivorans]UXP31800.1 S8 family serine peptidase [Reichenbachiella agarivorans]
MKKLKYISIILLWIGLQVTVAQGQESTLYLMMKDVPQSSTGRTVSNNITIESVRTHQAVSKVESMESTGQPNPQSRSLQQPKSKYLKGIYRLSVEESQADQLIQELQGYDNVQVVEREPEFQILVVPNDEQIAKQDYLAVIQAYDAWDVTRGDSTIVIGVSDTGFDMDHEDLVSKIYLNLDDPINGVDDDGNGYIDDYYGWDVADGDNDPTYRPSEQYSHGSNVAGMAAAATNNGKGIAGLAYRSKFLPVKLAKSSDGIFNNSYESIIYAADRGCDVINLSWGSDGSYSSIAQSIINYVVLEKDAVLVAAAGNTDAELDFYPASYDHVLSVAKSNNNDEKATKASWSYYVDIMAPGKDVFTTNINNNYTITEGSSFSSPLVAATAALVKSVFPKYNAIQIIEQIRMTADDVYDKGNNSNYYGMLGKGRLNVFRAVSEKNVAAMRSFDTEITTSFDGEVFGGDTVNVSLNFVNILRDLKGTKVTITCESELAHPINSELVLGNMYAFDTLRNINVKVVIKKDVPADTRISFRMSYHDNEGYDDFQYFHMTTAQDFHSISNGTIQQTISSKANLCYEEDQSSADRFGLKYKNAKIASSIGIAIGTQADRVSDNIINNLFTGERDQDFLASTNTRLYNREDVDEYARGIFTDSAALVVQGLLVEQEFMLWDDDDNNDFLIQEYRVTNVTDTDLAILKMGYYANLNVLQSVQNWVTWDATNEMGYTHTQTAGQLMVGVALLTEQDLIFHAIDLFDANGNLLDLASSVSDATKWSLMTTDKLSAGGAEGNDVAMMLTADLSTLAAHASEKVTFVTLFGYSSAELISNLEKARAKYQDFLENPALNWSQFACENAAVPLENSVDFYIYDDKSESNLIESGSDLSLVGFDSNTVLYYREYVDGYFSDLYAMFLQIFNPEVVMRADPTVYYLGDNPANKVQFIDESLTATKWSWDFSNGFYSKAKNPIVTFGNEGDYTVKLAIVTELGCEALGELFFQVKQRGAAPVFQTYRVCSGETVVISSASSGDLRFYNSTHATQPFFEGSEWETPALYESQTYYVSSTATENESVKIPVEVTVDPIMARFRYLPDTIDLSSSEMIWISDESTHAATRSWQLNGVSAGNNMTLTRVVSALTQMEILLTATSMDGCESKVSERVSFATSTQPGVNQNTIRRVCEKDLVWSQPRYGEYFAFYADEGLTRLVAKGKQAYLGPVLTDTSFYITNITDYHQSAAVELEIKVNSFDPTLTASPDQLILAESQYARFSASPDSEIASYQWYMDGQLIETTKTLNYTFFDAGNYAMELVAMSKLGCYDTLVMDYRVSSTVLSGTESNQMEVYPNPANSLLHIDVEYKAIQGLQVFSVLGQRYEISWVSWDDGMTAVSVSHLPSGVYFLEGRWNDEEFRRRFVKI